MMNNENQRDQTSKTDQSDSGENSRSVELDYEYYQELVEQNQRAEEAREALQGNIGYHQREVESPPRDPSKPVEKLSTKQVKQPENHSEKDDDHPAGTNHIEEFADTREILSVIYKAVMYTGAAISGIITITLLIGQIYPIALFTAAVGAFLLYAAKRGIPN